MAIQNTAIGSTNTTIYTAGAASAITTIIVCNTATFNPANPLADQTNLYLYAVPAGDVGGGVQAKHTIVNGLPVPAGETVSFEQERMVLGTGDIIVAKSDSPANLVVTVSTLAV